MLKCLLLFSVLLLCTDGKKPDGYEQQGACGCCDAEGNVKDDATSAPVDEDPSKSRIMLSGGKRPYIYAEPLCTGKKSKFCDLEKCMKTQEEETNMCGVSHIKTKLRQNFYGIQKGDVKAYKNKNVFVCCEYGYTCAMPDSEIADFLKAHQGLKTPHHKVFEGDPFNKDRTYLTTCGYKNRVCCPIRARIKVKLADGYHYIQEPACIENTADVNHGIQRSEERDQIKIKDIRERQKAETQRKIDELIEVYKKDLEGLYDGSLPSGWTSEVRFDRNKGSVNVNPTVIFKNEAKGEETRVRPHKPVLNIDLGIYEDQYGSEETKCESYDKADLMGSDIRNNERQKEADFIAKMDDYNPQTHSKCLVFSKTKTDQCIFDCQIMIEGTWASWWSRYNVILSGETLDMGDGLRSDAIQYISTDALKRLKGQYEEWTQSQRSYSDEEEMDTASRDQCLAVSRVLLRTYTREGEKETDNSGIKTFGRRTGCYKTIPESQLPKQNEEEEQEKENGEDEDVNEKVNMEECVQDYGDIEPRLPEHKMFDKRGGRGECYLRSSAYADTDAECFACVDQNVTPEMAKKLTDEHIRDYDVTEIGGMGKTKAYFGCYYQPDGVSGYRCQSNTYNEDGVSVPLSVYEETKGETDLDFYWKRVPSYTLTASEYGPKQLSKAKKGARIFLKEDCKKFMKTTCGESDFKHKRSARTCYDCVHQNNDERWNGMIDLPKDFNTTEKPHCAFDPIKSTCGLHQPDPIPKEVSRFEQKMKEAREKMKDKMENIGNLIRGLKQTDDDDEEDEKHAEGEESQPIVTVNDCDSMYEQAVSGGDESTLNIEIWPEETCAQTLEKKCVNRRIKLDIISLQGNIIKFGAFARLADLSATTNDASSRVDATLRITDITSHIALDEFFKSPLNKIFQCEGSKPKEPGDVDCVSAQDEIHVDKIIIMDNNTKLADQERSCIKCKSLFKSDTADVPWFYVVWEEDEKEDSGGNDDTRTGKAHFVRMKHEEHEEEEEEEEEEVVEESKDEKSADLSSEQALEDHGQCDNIKSFFQAASIVCDTRFVTKMTPFGPRRKEERAICCSESFSTCKNGDRVLQVDSGLCPTGACCWGDSCRSRTDKPSQGSCDYGDECCTTPTFLCRNGMSSYAHPDCPTRCCARGCSILFNYS